MSAANPARWRWVEAGVAFAIHDFQIAEHGGSDGVRDGGAIESALMRPVNLALYAEPDAADLAASYAYGLARNHGFVDGNKRVGLACCLVFLRLNGHRIRATDDELVQLVEDVAAGGATKAEVAVFLRSHLRGPASAK